MNEIMILTILITLLLIYVLGIILWDFEAFIRALSADGLLLEERKRPKSARKKSPMPPYVARAPSSPPAAAIPTAVPVQDNEEQLRNRVTQLEQQLRGEQLRNRAGGALLPKLAQDLLLRGLIRAMHY